MRLTKKEKENNIQQNQLVNNEIIEPFKYKLHEINNIILLNKWKDYNIKELLSYCSNGNFKSIIIRNNIAEIELRTKRRIGELLKK